MADTALARRRRGSCRAFQALGGPCPLGDLGQVGADAHILDVAETIQEMRDGHSDETPDEAETRARRTYGVSSWSERRSSRARVVGAVTLIVVVVTVATAIALTRETERDVVRTDTSVPTTVAPSFEASSSEMAPASDVTSTVPAAGALPWASTATTPAPVSGAPASTTTTVRPTSEIAAPPSEAPQPPPSTTSGGPVFVLHWDQMFPDGAFVTITGTRLEAGHVYGIAQCPTAAKVTNCYGGWGQMAGADSRLTWPWTVSDRWFDRLDGQFVDCVEPGNCAVRAFEMDQPGGDGVPVRDVGAIPITFPSTQPFIHVSPNHQLRDRQTVRVDYDRLPIVPYRVQECIERDCLVLTTFTPDPDGSGSVNVSVLVNPDMPVQGGTERHDCKLERCDVMVVAAAGQPNPAPYSVLDFA